MAAVFALAAVVLALAAGTGQAVADPQRGGTLVIGLNQAPRHLNPAFMTGHITAIPGTQIFASPLRYDAEWNLKPYLAESWNLSEDGLTLTLNLRKNARFHDGKPVTSEDVAFSIKAVKENHPFTSMFAPVSEVRTPDAHTVEVVLAHPHPAILFSMTSGLLPILPKHVYDDGQDLKSHPRNANPVGSGPFKVAEFKPGEHIILERNEDYFLEDQPYLDRVILKFYQDSTSMVLALEKGEVDMLPVDFR